MPGLLAVAILATSRPDLRAKLQAYRDEIAADVSRISCRDARVDRSRCDDRRARRRPARPHVRHGRAPPRLPRPHARARRRHADRADRRRRGQRGLRRPRRGARFATARRRGHVRVRERVGRRPQPRPRRTRSSGPTATRCRSRSIAFARRRFSPTTGLPVTPFASVRSEAELAAALERIGCPSVLKTSTFGYDGKGQMAIAPETDPRLPRGTRSDGRKRSSKRSSISSARSPSSARAASTASAPHSGRSRTRTAVTSSTSRWRRPWWRRQIAAQAIDGDTYASCDALEFVGILCVEFFVARDGRLLDQRAGAAAAQLGPPDVRCVPHEPVRAAAARDLRPAARIARAAAARGDGQPARRSLGGRRAALGRALSRFPDVKLHSTESVRPRPAARWATSRRSRRPRKRPGAWSSRQARRLEREADKTAMTALSVPPG